MKKLKTSHLGLLVFCFFAVLFFATPLNAQAATFKSCSRDTKIGKYYIWRDSNSETIQFSGSKSGNGSVLVRASSGRNLAHGCVSDGSTVYYVEMGPYVNNEFTGYVYKTKINSNGQLPTLIGKLQNASGITAYYKGNLYLDGYDSADSTVIHTYRMSVKNGKTKRMMKNASVMEQNGQYLIAMPNTGAIVPLSLYVYDCKKGKSTCITKKACSAHFVGKKIYYSEFVKFTGGQDVFRIRSCSLTGKSKKTLVKEIKASNVGKITSKYVYYIRFTDKANYYRYNFKTKKVKKISQSQFQ